jgi:hypothetical protein
LVAVLPHDRSCRLQSYADGSALVDKGPLGGNSLTTCSAVKIGGILTTALGAAVTLGLARVRRR